MIRESGKVDACAISQIVIIFNHMVVCFDANFYDCMALDVFKNVSIDDPRYCTFNDKYLSECGATTPPSLLIQPFFVPPAFII